MSQKYEGLRNIKVTEILGLRNIGSQKYWVSEMSGIRKIRFQKYRVTEVSGHRNIGSQKYWATEILGHRNIGYHPVLIVVLVVVVSVFCTVNSVFSVFLYPPPYPGGRPPPEAVAGDVEFQWGNVRYTTLECLAPSVQAFEYLSVHHIDQWCTGGARE